MTADYKTAVRKTNGILRAEGRLQNSTWAFCLASANLGAENKFMSNATNDNLQERIQAALANPQNLGELADADAVGTVGNSDCGEMLRMWVKFKQQDGRRIIDRATFQSFGCETAIAVASLATELIRGKTAEEALALKPDELAGELGALPPMKIHCAQLVEGALRSALAPATGSAKPVTESMPNPPAAAPSLLDSFSPPKPGAVKITFLDPGPGQ
jgi:nitrogen fixation protein NifU and related proteins